MNVLYSKALTRLLAQINVKAACHLEQLTSSMHNSSYRNIKVRELVRVSDSLVRTALKMPCPINRIDQQQIEAFKQLRRTYNVSQSSACSKCPFSSTCPSAYAQPISKIKSKLDHLVYYLVKIDTLKPEQVSPVRWDAAYKLAHALRLSLEDPEAMKREAELFQELEKINKQPETQHKRYSANIYRGRKYRLEPVNY